MFKKPAQGLFFVTALLLLAVSSVGAQESPANQRAFGSGPVGAYSLSASPGPNPGQVILTWKQARSDVQNFHIVYGTSPNNFQYGSLNIDGNLAVGKSISFTVGYLKPGTKYFFALSPLASGTALPYTFQVTSLPKPGAVTPPPTPPTQAGATPSAALTSTDADSFKNQSARSIKAGAVGLHQLSAKKGAKPGEVLLTWKQAFSDTDNYDIVYGTEPGKFKHGALSIGKTTSFTVKGLDPNKHYFFALVPVKGGVAQYITAQTSDKGAPKAGEAGAQATGASGGAAGAAGGGAGGSAGTTGGPGGGTGGGGTTGVGGGTGGGGGAGGGKGGAPAAVSQPAGGGGGAPSAGKSGETKQEEPKKKPSRKHRVKGVSCSLPWFLSSFLPWCR